MIVLTVILAILVCICYTKGKKRLAYNKFATQIGGPVGYPVIGSALEFIKNFDRTLVTLTKWVNQYGNRVFFFFGPCPVLLINNAEDVEKVCTSTDLTEKSEDYDLVTDWLGEGLITSNGQLWAYRRKLITPCFHFSILERFIEPINEQTKILVDILKENFQGNTGFKDITPFIARCALDMICETSMGIKMNSQKQQKCDYVDAVHRMGELFQYKHIRPWLRTKFLWYMTAKGREEAKCLQLIHSFTDKVIADRKRSRSSSNTKENGLNLEESKSKKKALLDLLLDAQQEDKLGFSDRGIRDESTTFIFAGHDTVSVTTSFCLYNLGCHPEIQARVHEELDSIFGSDRDRPVTSSDLKSMKYMELCIKESLRMYPSVPLIGRSVNKAFRLDENTVVPPGVVVYLFSYTLHRNPKNFPKPGEFIPERFDIENEEYGNNRRNPFAYIPFSAGARNCVGQKLAMIETKIILANILRRFQIQSEKKGEELELLSELVMRVKGGLKVKLESR